MYFEGRVRYKLRGSCALEYSLVAVASGGRDADAIDLGDVAMLTFRRGEYTTGRRTRPVPQLACAGGELCARWESSISSVQCKNAGTDDRGEYQWRCEGNLDKGIKVLCTGEGMAVAWRIACA